MIAGWDIEPFEWYIDQCDILAVNRIDRALANRVEEVSRGRIAQWIKQGHILVNERKVKASYQIKVGDIVRCTPPPSPSVELKPQNVPFDIMYEDMDLAVISKPAGVVVHPGAGNPDKTLVNGLLERLKTLSPVGLPHRPGIVHRLDRDTSGLLVVARTEQAHHHLSQQLAKRTMKRIYLALSWGTPKGEGLLDTNYGRHPKHRIKFSSKVKQGKRAITRWKVLAEMGPASLLALKLETGRTHQIRVHMSEAGAPLIADQLYGSPRRVNHINQLRTLGVELGLSRQALHASVLTFIHPRTGIEHFYSAPLPEELERVIIQLLEAEGVESPKSELGSMLLQKDLAF